MDPQVAQLMQSINFCLNNGDANNAISYIHYLMTNYYDKYMFSIRQNSENLYDSNIFGCRDINSARMNDDLYKELIEVGYCDEDAKYMCKNTKNYEEAAKKLLNKR